LAEPLKYPYLPLMKWSRL